MQSSNFAKITYVFNEFTNSIESSVVGFDINFFYNLTQII